MTREMRILDIGAGDCILSESLNNKGYDVVSIDVINKSRTNIKPVLYDGLNIPYPDNSFDVAILRFVLHHCYESERVLHEAMRVSKYIIVSEDLYFSYPQKQLTYLIDSFLNNEWRGHPHNNKTYSEWNILFKRMGFIINDFELKRWGLLKHGAWVLCH